MQFLYSLLMDMVNRGKQWPLVNSANGADKIPHTNQLMSSFVSPKPRRGKYRQVSSSIPVAGQGRRNWVHISKMIMRLVAIGQLRYAPRTKRPADLYNRSGALQKDGDQWYIFAREKSRRSVGSNFSWSKRPKFTRRLAWKPKIWNFEFVNSWKWNFYFHMAVESVGD